MWEPVATGWANAPRMHGERDLSLHNENQSLGLYGESETKTITRKQEVRLTSFSHSQFHLELPGELLSQAISWAAPTLSGALHSGA